MNQKIRVLDELGAEFTRVCAEAAPASAGARAFGAGVRARTLSVTLATTITLAGTAYAVPTTRTAFDGITGSLAAWVTGAEDSAPGRAVAPDDNAPLWLSERATNDIRLIAETAGVGLYVRRIDSRESPQPDQGPMLGFSLGQGLGMSAPLETWQRRLSEHAVYVLGESIFGGERGVLDDQGRIPLFGVTTRDVERIELQYQEGPPLVSRNGDGGFVLLVDAWRPMQEIIAYDAHGKAVGRADVSGHDLRYQCEKEPGCPPTTG